MTHKVHLSSMSPTCSLIGLALLLAGCGSGSSPESPAASGPEGGQHENADFSQQRVLEDIGARVFETYQEFADRIETLEATTEAYAGSLDPDDLTDAQEAWREAMVLWERAELFRFGPAGEEGAVEAGQGLADEIYSFVVSTNFCRVDQETVEESFMDDSAFAAEPVNVRGLDAMEYLLFTEDQDNQCAANVTLNSSGTWEERLTEIEVLRADYAYALARNIGDQAEALLMAWDPSGEAFLDEFVYAGDGMTVYPNAQAAFSAIGNAMFYLDTQTKDRKVGIPAGVLECTEEICPDALESLFAHASKTHILNNLHGLEVLFFGGMNEDGDDSFGMEDQLRDIGANSLADDFAVDIQGAFDSIERIEEDTLLDALNDNHDTVVDLYTSIKQVTDRLKAEFVTELELDITAAGPGDAD